MSQQPQPSHLPEQPPQESETDAATPPKRPLRHGQGEKYTDIPNSQVLVLTATSHPHTPPECSWTLSLRLHRSHQGADTSQQRPSQLTDMGRHADQEDHCQAAAGVKVGGPALLLARPCRPENSQQLAPDPEGAGQQGENSSVV